MNKHDTIRPGHSSATRGVVIIVVLFVSITLLLAGLIYVEGRVFDGVRSYVRGEGLWAKAQKDAVLYLERYSHSRSDTEYLSFKRSIRVIQGDSMARAALLQSPPDLPAARKGFLQGLNDVQDVDSMIWFFLNFQQISYLHDAIEIWKEGDRKIAELTLAAEALRHELSSRHIDLRKMENLKAQIQMLNTDLLVLENRFSEVLSEGARWIREVVWEASLALLVIVVGTAILVSRRIVRAIAASERELLVSESRFSSLKESNTIGIATWNMDGRMVEANDMLLHMLGFERADLEAGLINWRELTPAEFRDKDKQAIRQLEDHGRCEPYEKSFFNRNGSLVPVYMGGSLLQGDHDEQQIAFVIDMTERKKAEEALQLAGLVYEASSEAIIVTDPDNHIISVNPAFTILTGYTFDEVKGKNPRLLSSGRQDKAFYEEMWGAITKTGKWRGEIWNCRKNGEVYAELMTINTIYNPDGSVHRRVALFLDISEQKKAEEIIKHHANHDALTGLPNRRMVHDLLEQQIKKARREKLPLALLFIDLDHFKEVNDTHGHEVGDLLLKEAAWRMSSCVRESDTLGRLGGDEFVIVLSDLNELENVQRVVNEILARLSRPFRLNNVEAMVSASIGIAFYPEDAQDAEMLFRNADQAMYAVKREGRNGFQYFKSTGETDGQDRSHTG